MEGSRKFPRVPEGSQWGQNTWIITASINHCAGGTCTVSRVALLVDAGQIVGSVPTPEDRERQFATILDAIMYCSSKENIVWLCGSAESTPQLLGTCRDEGLLYDEAGDQITDPDLPQCGFLFERRPMTPDGAQWEQLQQQADRKLYLRVPVPATAKAS